MLTEKSFMLPWLPFPYHSPCSTQFPLLRWLSITQRLRNPSSANLTLLKGHLHLSICLHIADHHDLHHGGRGHSENTNDLAWNIGRSKLQYLLVLSRLGFSNLAHSVFPWYNRKTCVEEVEISSQNSQNVFFSLSKISDSTFARSKSALLHPLQCFHPDNRICEVYYKDHCVIDKTLLSTRDRHVRFHSHIAMYHRPLDFLLIQINVNWNISRQNENINLVTIY